MRFSYNTIALEGQEIFKMKSECMWTFKDQIENTLQANRVEYSRGHSEIFETLDGNEDIAVHIKFALSFKEYRYVIRAEEEILKDIKKTFGTLAEDDVLIWRQPPKLFIHDNENLMLITRLSVAKNCKRILQYAS